MTLQIIGCRYNGVYVPCELCELQDSFDACFAFRHTEGRTNVQATLDEVEE